jgi:RNA polymerase sigma-70 factor (ECF subfamily)
MMNLLIDRHRHRTRQRDANPRRYPVAEAAPVAITDDVWRSAVRSLPARQRAAIVLYYVVDLSIDEVADVMRVAPGTVKATLSQARAALKAIVADEVTS